MTPKSKKIRAAFVIFWFLFIYILAALIFWFVELNDQNHLLFQLKLKALQPDQPGYLEQVENISNEKRRKTAQYIGEGAIFMLLILGGAVYIFRKVRREFRQAIEQQNFMMSITHELKTPIAVTKLNLETILFRKLDEEQRNRLIQISLQESNRLDTLCNKLLLSSQLDAGGYQVNNEETDWSALVSTCVEESRGRFPGRVIQTNIQPNIHILCDHVLIEMVVNNLIENAFKYSPKDKPIEVFLQQKNGTGILQVRDYGMGIAEEDREKVFKKFTRLGNEATVRAKGTGLGLFLVKRIVLSVKGTVYIRANQPQGSIFVVEIKSIN